MRKICLLSVVLLFLSGCDGCGDEIVKYTVGLASTPMVEKRISGVTYLTFVKGDPSDSYAANDGYLCVTHNPGCGSWIFSTGNDGVDKYFDSKHDLPPGCQVLGVDFIPYWPAGISSRPTVGSGWGSYGAIISGGGFYPYNIEWNNSCHGDFDGKPLYYSISFRVLMPVGTDMGEPVYDLNSNLPKCQVEQAKINQNPPQCSISKTAQYSLNLTYIPQYEGPIYYGGTLTAPFCGGNLKKIVNSQLYSIELHTDKASVTLGPGASTTPADLQALFGSSTPALPISIAIHPGIVINPASVNSIPITMEYDYLE
jgi:hypothetical protein